MYNGSESDPTIIVGVYPTETGSVFAIARTTPQTLTGDVYITAVPESATISLLLIGSGFLSAMRFLKRV